MEDLLQRRLQLPRQEDPRLSEGSHIERRLLAVAAGLFAICALHGAAHLGLRVLEAGRRLLTLDGEERRLLVYGRDCDVRGYGYIRRVTDGIPRDGGLPRVTSFDETYPSDVVLPEDDWNRESRIVIGIGFDEAAFQERLLTIDGGQSFSVVQRTGGCFTAVSPEILQEERGESGRWRAWLARLRHLP